MEISVVPSIAVWQHRLRVYGIDHHEVEREIPLTPCHSSLTQPTKVKGVGTFHVLSTWNPKGVGTFDVPSTWNPGKSLTANDGACLHLSA